MERAREISSSFEAFCEELLRPIAAELGVSLDELTVTWIGPPRGLLDPVRRPVREPAPASGA